MSQPMPTIVFDLDGTLSCGKHRRHLLPTEETRHLCEAWDAFNLAAYGDAPITDNTTLLCTLYANNKIIILTGRSAIAREITEDWLDKHEIPYDVLLMRPEGDHRKDIDFKTEQLGYIRAEYGPILCCFDDLEHVVKHIRSLGITCHQVTHYDIKTTDTTPQQKAGA